MLQLARATHRDVPSRERVASVLDGAVAVLKQRDPTNKKDIKLNLAKAALNMVKAVV
eukprot:SAG11_NODE_24336_length_374_cov_5.603636_1_plen_56_part_10